MRIRTDIIQSVFLIPASLGLSVGTYFLAIILGGLLERSLQKALQVSGADPMIFIDKPLSAALLAVALLVVLIPLFKWGMRRLLT